MLLPMPDEAPVTTTVLPSRRFAIADVILRFAVCEVGRNFEMVCEPGLGRFTKLEKMSILLRYGVISI